MFSAIRTNSVLSDQSYTRFFKKKGKEAPARGWGAGNVLWTIITSPTLPQGCCFLLASGKCSEGESSVPALMAAPVTGEQCPCEQQGDSQPREETVPYREIQIRQDYALCLSMSSVLAWKIMSYSASKLLAECLHSILVSFPQFSGCCPPLYLGVTHCRDLGVIY